MSITNIISKCSLRFPPIIHSDKFVLRNALCRMTQPCLNFCSELKYNVSDTGDVEFLQEAETRNEIRTDAPSDTFGNLRVPLEKRKRNKLAKPVTNESPKKSWFTEQEFNNRRPDNSDVFGNLSNKNAVFCPLPVEEVDEPGDDSRLEFPISRKYRTPEAYLRRMKILVRDRKLKEALELFPDMKKNNVFPIHANYTFMVGACGRAGYQDMAFQLLRQMTDRGYRPTPATLTGLFNSCAESPFPELALQKAKALKEKIASKNWALARPTYHAMIKCFGKCGDIEASFQIVDEMVEAGVAVAPETYSFLLMSCISNKEAGFTHAIEVWRKMLSKKIPPNQFSFNLLLRAVRDCGVGPEEVSSLLLQHWSSYRKRPYGLNDKLQLAQKPIEMLKLSHAEFPAIAAGPDEEPLETSTDSKNTIPHTVGVNKDNVTLLSVKEKEADPISDVITNILEVRPVHGPAIVDLLAITKPFHRLALVGNPSGFLDLMKKFKVQPNIKTITLMLESLESTNQAEEELLSLMDSFKVYPDTDFFNILIKKRKLRKDHNSAKNVLLLIQRYNLCPDIVTFGVLALECHGRKHGTQLLQEMKQLGFHPNVEILGALIHAACSDVDFPYLQTLLNQLKENEISLNERIRRKIDDAISNLQADIADKEQGGTWTRDVPFETAKSQLEKFSAFYSSWLQSANVEKEEHPWLQYKTDIIYREGTETDLRSQHEETK